MDSVKTTKIVSSRLLVEISASELEVTVSMAPSLLKNFIRGVEKFILFTSRFEVDAFTASLTESDEYLLYVDRITNFIYNFDNILVRKNNVSHKKLQEARDTTEYLYNFLESGRTFPPFAFKREDMETLIPEFETVRYDMRTHGNVTYLSYISCEAILLTRQALAFEEMW